MRKRGRPWGSALKISAEAVKALPKYGSASTYARVLGVTPTTLRNWIIFEHAPAAKRHSKQGWTLRRMEFVAWLEKQGRLADENLRVSQVS